MDEDYQKEEVMIFLKIAMSASNFLLVYALFPSIDFHHMTMAVFALAILEEGIILRAKK